ncbi:MAG: hypothetical protein ABIE25_06550 [Thermoplasmatota archaeon]|nr:hypothetical protein [Candidatus Thermoplasmatota archaeon]MBU1914562.1 hypothetical protein [Candidatus Thermoplasmatota archaeon]
MPASGRVLEDSIRLSRIRRIKLTLYIVQAVMLIALGFLLIFVVGGATLKPHLYVPLDSFLAVLVLLLLIICLESFFFRMLEIKFARSSSARHLMAKNSMKRAVLIAIVAGIAAMVLAVPSIVNAVESSVQQRIVVSPGVEPPSFYSSDIMNLVKTNEVDVTAAKQVEVYLLEDKIFSDYWEPNSPESMNLMSSYRLNRENFEVLENQVLVIEVPYSGFVLYHLVLNDMENPNTSIRVDVVKELSGTFTGIISLLMSAFVVTNIAWVTYLIPIERKYGASSIYK